MELTVPAAQIVRLDVRTDWSQRLVAIGTPFTVLVAMTAIWFGQQTDARQYALAEQGQVTDRFNQAVEHLGSDRTDIQIGGAYALRRIMRDSPTDQASVVTILSAYVRTHTLNPPDDQESQKPESGPTADVQIILNILTRPASPGPLAPDLHGADLHDADLHGADLRDADLHGANLRGADLRGANLHGANLTHANLSHARITGPILRGACGTAMGQAPEGGATAVSRDSSLLVRR